VRRDRHRPRDRRPVRPRRRHRARRQPLPLRVLRALPLLSRSDTEDHLLPDHDHVVRGRPRLQGGDGRDLLLLPDRAVGGRRHAPDRQGADPRREELPRQYLPDGEEDLPAGDAPSDHQRRAAGARRRHHRHAARRDQAVEPRCRLPHHPGLQPVRHAAHVRDADRSVRAGDRRQCADRKVRRARHDPTEVRSFDMTRLATVVFAVAALTATSALADDQLKLTIGQRGNWDTAITQLGTKAGIFKKHGIELEMIYTSGSGETLQPIIGGSADLGLAVGTLGAISAYAKGAPVRIIGAQATGAADYWYAKTSSPIKTLKDTTDKTTIGFSTNGSSTHSVVRAFVSEFGVKAKPTPTGNPSSTLTAVMTDQVDIGWAAPPFGLKEIDEGKIHVVAKATDATLVRGQTIPTIVTNADVLAKKKDPIARFMKADR